MAQTGGVAEQPQDDVEIVSHYADEDGRECVQALLLLAGYDKLSAPPPDSIKPPRRRRRQSADTAA